MRSPFKRYGRRLAAGGPILNLASAAVATPLAPAADVYTDDTYRSISEHDLTVVEPRIEAVLLAEFDKFANHAPADTSNLYCELPCGHLKPFPWDATLAAYDPDDATAPEGHAVAAALAADRSAARMVRDAGELVEFAEASLVRALQKLSCVGAEDPTRPLIDRVFVETTRVKNELVGVVEKFHQVGVRS